MLVKKNPNRSIFGSFMKQNVKKGQKNRKKTPKKAFFSPKKIHIIPNNTLKDKSNLQFLYFNALFRLVIP